jgi:uroporphyrinogen-III synthase
LAIVKWESHRDMPVDTKNRRLEGLRVLALESRRAAEMAKLIENYGGTAVSAPSMREIPAAENREALAFAQDLLAGRFHAVLFLTGVGTRILFRAMETAYSRDAIVAALSRTITVARGPNPAAVLREFAVPVVITVPEPNTWRDLLKTLDERRPAVFAKGLSIAVQEYGVSNREFLKALQSRGVQVTRVPVYQWALPEDIGPLRRAIGDIAAGRIDVMLVTSATQVNHLMQVAAQAGLEGAVRSGLRQAVTGSIGPISTEALHACGLAADFEPSHPKMGQLVFDAAGRAPELLARKRRRPQAGLP